MHQLLQVLFAPWDLRSEVLVVLIPLGVLYTVGWRRLRKQSVRGRLATWPRLLAYVGGLFVVALALMSPIDSLGSQLLVVHMFQHMLLMTLAVPLLLLANPFPFFIWSLPATPRYAVAGLFTRRSPVRWALAMITAPAVTWIAFTVVYYGWHDSTLYSAALNHGWVHDIQHITFFLAALLFWWPIIGPAPQVRGRMPGWGRFGYILAAVPINMAFGITIAFTSEVLYPYYETVPRIWGLTVMQDQKFAGALMWVSGSEMLIWAAIIVLATMFPRKGDAPQLPAGWDNDAAMIAPGLESRVLPRRTTHPPVRPLPATKTP